VKASEKAEKKFREGFNCAQSVIYSFADKLNLEQDQALRISNGFGGGMGRKQEVCGAVSGAIMVLGMMYGRGENEDREKQEKTYAKVREFIDKFEAKFKTVNCKSLLDGCELLTAEGQEMFKNNNLKEKCCNYVKYAADLLSQE
jgi:C_GCAxxG_C_C family probable redox protein